MVESRSTRQKRILHEEKEKIKGFFNAQEFFDIVSSKDKKIGIATVYRYLKELRSKGEIYSYECSGKTIYSTSKKSHCHFTCTKTGKTFHFEIDNLDFLEGKIPGTIESISINVEGVCCEHDH